MVLGYGFLLLTLAAGCGTADSRPEVKNEVTTAAPATFLLQKEKMMTSLHLPGELLAFQQVDLYAKVTSFVKTLKVDIGSEVTAGQLLVTLEAPELISQLAAAESRLRSQEAIYTASKANYDRLVETARIPGTISQNDLDQAMARKSSDFAQLQAAQALHKEVSTMQGYLEIRAPFNGIITARNVNPGAYVGPTGKGSEFPLFTLQEQKKLRLAISVPEAYTGYVSNGDEISFKVRAFPSRSFTTKIKRMAGALDLRLRSERIEMDVINEDKKLLPGMVTEVTVELPAKDSAFVVPRTAVLSTDEGIFVVKVVNNKAVKVKVLKGRELQDKTEIFGDLAEKEVLLTKPAEDLRQGTEIR